jgi:hypothetical protein
MKGKIGKHTIFSNRPIDIEIFITFSKFNLNEVRKLIYNNLINGASRTPASEG